MSLDEVLAFLSENTTVHLATVDADGHPRVRPFVLFAFKDGKLYFATSRDKDVCKDLKRDPRMEISAVSPYAHWLRIKGKAVFLEDEKLKEKLLDETDAARVFYKSEEGGKIEIFYLESAEAFMSNLSDRMVKTFKL